MSEVTPVPVAPPPAEPAASLTDFEGLVLKARRIPNTDLESGRWELYTELNGITWILASRKLGGLDDDLQEQATPGFKEARAVRYGQDAGRPRTEPGPGA